ncbi:MAG: septal ring lytic transglycosylase RlpA family protein [Burkholderiales bacterium]
MLIVFVAGCGSASRTPERAPPTRPAPPVTSQPAPQPQTSPSESAGTPRRGAYYKDDGPGERIPPNLEATPDAVPEDVPPLRSAANRPYVVFGRTYTPMSGNGDFRQRGVASWYGRKFHGQRTSSGEIYDMFAMTAAHPTLPLLSWARVVNPANGRAVVVRVNDRGPFHSDRVIDLSYTAALKLGYVNHGSALVEIQRVRVGDFGAAARAPVQARAPDAAQSVPAATSSEGVPVAGKPAAPPSKPPPPVVLATASQPDGVYLQLGAFGAAAGAEEFRIKTYQQLPWLTEAIYIVARDGVHRVQLGPYADRAAAQVIADRIRETLQLRAVFVVR